MRPVLVAFEMRRARVVYEVVAMDVVNVACRHYRHNSIGSAAWEKKTIECHVPFMLVLQSCPPPLLFYLRLVLSIYKRRPSHDPLTGAIVNGILRHPPGIVKEAPLNCPQNTQARPIDEPS